MSDEEGGGKKSGYRLEYSPSARAKCKGPKPCSGTPIVKGELRLGSIVDFRGNTSFAWRHWGCTTAKILANMKKSFESASELDGYDELRPEDQEKIDEAWEAGHVADEDIPESARKPDDSEGEEVKKKPAKKKAKKADDDEEEAEEKPKKKAAAPSKKRAKKVDDEDADEKPKKRIRKKAKDDGDEDEKPKKKRAPPKKKSKKPVSDAESGEDFGDAMDNVSFDEDEPEDEEDAPKKKKPAPKAKSSSKPASKAKATKYRKSKKEVVSDMDDDYD